MLVRFTGKNASLQAYGFRFEKDKPVLVDDTKVLAKLKERNDFELLEPEKTVNRKKGEGTITTQAEEGGADADTREGKAAK